MAKVVSLLERMGLVAPVRDRQPATVLPEPEPATAEAVEPRPHRPEHRTIPQVTFTDEVAADATDNPEDFPLDRVYASAGITAPEHGFTVDKLVEMMGAEEFAALEPATKATVITGLLRRLPGGAVAIDDIVTEAARRDQALDAFELFLGDRVRRTAAEVDESNAALQREVDDLTRRNGELMAANQRRLNDEEARFDRWMARKRSEEQRLFDAVRPFVAANPVTLSDPDGP